MGYRMVSSKESSDFVRLIFPDESGGKGYNIQEYYKNGNVKFVGKATERLTTVIGGIAYDGNCISYFPNGTRQKICHYSDGHKEGYEYFFYPDGKRYSTKKHVLGYGGNLFKIRYWECSDLNGNLICSDGNGSWISYDDSFEHVILRGTVKNGERTGEWTGRTMKSDSSTYKYLFKNDVLVSAVGYDKAGAAYPFKEDIEPARYWKGPIFFLRALQDNLKLPKDDKEKKISADDAFISFIVETDGSLTNLETLTDVDPALKKALTEALAKCKAWVPRKNYGIPVRAKIYYPMKYISTYSQNAFRDEIVYKEEQLDN